MSAFLLCGCGGGSGSDWPPPLESLFDPDTQACALPECDESGPAGFEPSADWWRTLTTTATSCPEMLAQFNPRVTIGNQDEEGPLALDDFNGTCFYQDGQQVATVRRGIFARCVRTSEGMEVVSYSTAVVEFDRDRGQGKARVYLRNLPGDLQGCDIDLDVDYRVGQ